MKPEFIIAGVILLTIFILIAGCTEADATRRTVPMVEDDFGFGVRITDTEYGAVCYVINSGVDCIPCKDLGGCNDSVSQTE